MSPACLVCGRQFEAVRHRLCCDRRCAAKLARQNRGLDPWEAEAEFWLEQHAGRWPLDTLCRRFKSAARRQGWAARTDTAIELKLRRLRLSCKCTEDNLTRRELARQLEISTDRVRGWTERGLPYRKVARNQVAIRLSDVRAYLLAHPELATGISERSLAWLVGDKAAQQIMAAPKSRRGFYRPVICLDTGERFEGIKAAGRAKFVSHGSIGEAIRRGGKAAGYRWAYVDELEL